MKKLVEMKKEDGKNIEYISEINVFGTIEINMYDDGVYPMGGFTLRPHEKGYQEEYDRIMRLGEEIA